MRKQAFGCVNGLQKSCHFRWLYLGISSWGMSTAGSRVTDKASINYTKVEQLVGQIDWGVVEKHLFLPKVKYCGQWISYRWVIWECVIGSDWIAYRLNWEISARGGWNWVKKPLLEQNAMFPVEEKPKAKLVETFLGIFKSLTTRHKKSNYSRFQKQCACKTPGVRGIWAPDPNSFFILVSLKDDTRPSKLNLAARHKWTLILKAAFWWPPTTNKKWPKGGGKTNKRW